MKSKVISVVLVALAALALASAAGAHHVSGGTATCTDLTATFEQFADQDKPINYVVKADSSIVASDTYTFSGSSGTLTVTFASPLPAGDHTMQFSATWPTGSGGFTQVVHGCAGPPPPPPPPPAAAPPTAPPTTAPTAAPPATPPVANRPAPRRHRRFGTPKHPRKRCVHGRRHLTDSHGRHFTMCRSKAPESAVRRPNFTG